MATRSRRPGDTRAGPARPGAPPQRRPPAAAPDSPPQVAVRRRPGVGLPIGSLTSQCFANLYLDPLDQFIKHRLKVKGYLRYMDDMILLADDAETLVAHQRHIAAFLGKRLGLALPPARLCCSGSIRAPISSAPSSIPSIARYASTACAPCAGRRLHAFQALLQRMLATLNSYYGLFRQANTFRLRHHLYHRELGELRRFFVPADAAYSHLRLRRHWLMIRRD